ncbi:MAG: hypothetical protein ACJA0E_000951 [Bermanella sp.]|jgi:hypothetical protein
MLSPILKYFFFCERVREKLMKKAPMAVSKKTYLACLPILFALSGCGGSSAEPSNLDQPVSMNLGAASLNVVTLEPRVGFPLTVSLSIEADEVANDVGVAFFVFDRDRSMRQLPIGTGIINEVPAGINSFEIELEVPSNVEFAGNYYLAAIIDTANGIEETDEDDNKTSTQMTLLASANPNLFIEKLEVDSPFVEVDISSGYVKQDDINVVNSDAGGTITWGAKGTKEPFDVELFTVLRFTKLTEDSNTQLLDDFQGLMTIEPTPANINGVVDTLDVPLYLWNSEQQRYMNAYGIDPETGNSDDSEWLSIGQAGQISISNEEGSESVTITEFDRRTAHLDFYFPGRLGQVLSTNLRLQNVAFGIQQPPPDLSQSFIDTLKSFIPNGKPGELNAEICVSIRPASTDVVDADMADNQTCTPIALIFPALPPIPPVPEPPAVDPIYTSSSNPVSFEESFNTAWGGSFFGFGVDFGASMSADNRGAIVNAHGKLPLQIFGNEVEFMKLDGRAQVLPLSNIDNPPAGAATGFSIQLSHQGLLLANISQAPVSTQPLLLFYSKDFANREKTITVGPIPVKLKGALTGNIGVEYKINLNKDINGNSSNDGLNFITSPFANIEVSMAASVTAFLADVGIEGVVTLLQEKINIITGASIDVQDNRHSNGTSEIVITPRMRVINEFSLPSGAINVFVSLEVPTVVECSWGFFTGICPGTSTLKYPYNIVSLNSFKKTDVLFDKSAVIDIVTLPNGFSSYYR